MRRDYVLLSKQPVVGNMVEIISDGKKYRKGYEYDKIDVENDRI